MKKRWGDVVTLKQYGLNKQWIREVKSRCEDQIIMDQVKKLVDGVTKEDLQSEQFLTRKIKQIAPVIGVKISRQHADGVIRFIRDQKIDPDNTWHLIKLWNIFRKY
jgi:hypothetical protein